MSCLISDVEVELSTSRLMSIPTELRLKIWRLLLLAPNVRVLDGFKRSGTSPHFDFAMPLLCTCRKIYNEASAVLYEENLWSVLTEENMVFNPHGRAFYTNQNTAGSIEEDRSISLPTYSKIKDSIKNPVLTVDISYSDPKMSEKSGKYQYAVAFDRYILLQICSVLWIRVLAVGVNMTLSLREHPRGSRFELHSLLLRPFKVLRGLKEVTIKGVISGTVCQDLNRTLRSSFNSYPEYKEILTEYKTEGDLLFGEKRYGEALLVYRTGLTFDINSPKPPSANTAPAARHRYEEVVTRLANNAMLAELRVGNFASVISLADSAFKYWGTLKKDRFQAHHSRGIAFYKMGNYYLATQDLFYALKLSPDDSVTKSWLGAAEKQLGFEAKDVFRLATFSVQLQNGNTWIWTGDPRLLELPGWRRARTRVILS